MSKIVSAAFLLAGTAIGAGMLALPVTTAEGGFWPALLVYALCWLFSASTGLLLLEACLWLPRRTNIISLSSYLLGKGGAWASWILYLFLFYCLTIAYAAGGGRWIVNVMGETVPIALSIGIFVALFSSVVVIGTQAVDRLNFLLMVGLITFFITFVCLGVGKVDDALLGRANFPAALWALPVVFTSFSYQGIVPSMRDYFPEDSRAVRKVVLIGSAIPLLIYVVWEYLILGLIPLGGPDGLLMAKRQGLTGIAALKEYAGSPIIYVAGQAFTFCALTTSFLGVTLGLFDFFADGLNMHKRGWQKCLLYLIVYLPPTVIAMLKPDIFLRALSYAGGIGCALLLGLLPILMVWSGRYRRGLSQNKRQLPGGKPVLILLILFVLFELIVEMINELHIILKVA